MTIEEIKELIQVFHESDVGEMEVQRGTNRLRLARSVVRHEVAMPAASASLGQGVAGPPHAPPVTHSGAGAAPARTSEPDSNHLLVKSPIVGTYYDQASPGSPVFVKVGDAVEPGQVLCIIESMKLMNEIEAEVAGTVVAKLVENGHPVEYGEALFAIRPRS